ncbi:unnamed protein product [Calicophoron daubneyi]|uniref:Uncharacterized protein n=1 Tax=Calicophoron daubneyi TaxID=300641 RepID=A0AAV2T641_CALDB
MYFSTDIYCSQLELILDKENVSLVEVLLDPMVIDECKAENKKLIAYLTQPDRIKELVEATISGPDPSASMVEQFRKSHVASELLASTVPKMSYALLRNTEALDTLYNSLHRTDLTPLGASFVYKIFLSLIQCSSSEVQTYFVGKKDLAHCITSHVDKPAVMELVYRVVQLIDGPEITNHLADSSLVFELLQLFNIDQTDEIHASVVQCLAGLLASCRLKMRSGSDVSLGHRNRLQEKLESYETIKSITACIFGDPDNLVSSDSLLINGLLYFRCLIDPAARMEASPDLPPLPRDDCVYLWSEPVGSSLCAVLLPYLPALQKRLLCPTKIPKLENSAGAKTLTAARLHIARFVHYLFLCKSELVIRELLNLGFLTTLLDLFFEFSLNSFLHATFLGLINFIVLRAMLNVSLTTSSDFPSPKESNALSSADAVQKIFFSVGESQLKSSDSDVDCEKDTPESAANGSDGNSGEPVNIFWMFLNQLLVDGNLLERIYESFIGDTRTSHPPGNRGHLRLIANLLTAVIGPKQSGEKSTLSTSTEVQLITAEQLSMIAANGSTNECDYNPPLYTYLRSRLSEASLNRWCEFVTSKLVESNEKCYVNYGDFPNSLTSSDQTAPEYKLTDLAISQALQNAYANYCSQSLTSAFMDNFGFVEDEFLESQTHPNLLLDSRLSEVSFSLHVNEDSENGEIFEQACNDAIQLNGEDVGKEGIRLEEEDVVVSPSAPPPVAADENGEQSKTAEQRAKIPSRDRLIEVFNEIGGISALDRGSVDNFPSEIYSTKLGHNLTTSTSVTSYNYSNHSNMKIHSHPVPSLPTVTESDADLENEDGEDLYSDSDKLEAKTTHFSENLLRFDRNSRSPSLLVPQLYSGPPTTSSTRVILNGSTPKQPTKAVRSTANRRPTPPIVPDLQALRMLKSDSRLNGLPHLYSDSDPTVEIDAIVRGESEAVHEINNNDEPVVPNSHTLGEGEFILDPDPHSEQVFSKPCLSAWRTQTLFKNANTEQNTPANFESVQYNGLNGSIVENIELGDLSSGSIQLDDVASIPINGKQTALTAELSESAQRHWIMPTKRPPRLRVRPKSSTHSSAPSAIGTDLDSAPSPDYVDLPNGVLHSQPVQDNKKTFSVITSNGSGERLLTVKSPHAFVNESGDQPSSLLPSSPGPVRSNHLRDNGPPVQSPPQPHAYPLSPHKSAKTTPSCGILATIKIRHASKSHSLPQFVIDEDEFATDEFLKESPTCDTLEHFDPAVSDTERTSDPSLSKARYRTHRTIQLRPGTEGQAIEP